MIRPRISILTALLLTAMLGMGFVIARQWRELVPLRAEVRQLRTEVGHLSIDDPTKIYAISVPTVEQDTWKWRVYLPPSGTYTLHEQSGRLPTRRKLSRDAWFNALANNGSGMSTSGASFKGEFLVEAKLVKEDNDWVLVTHYQHSEGGSATSSTGRVSISQQHGDWLSDRRSRMTTSDVSVASQSTFEPGAPVLLLHLIRPIITDTPGGGHSSKAPEVDADGVVLWVQ